MKCAPVAAVIAFILACGAVSAQDAIMPLDQVRPGMTGVMRTVLKGIELTDIPIEVVDVMRRVAPGHDVILIRLHGDTIERVGVARGMSGSPVYIDGKVIGALAFAWRFVKEPIAGLTPIESMIRMKPEAVVEQPAAVAMTWKPGQTLPIQELMERLLNPRPTLSYATPANMRTLETPVALSGFSRSSAALLGDHLKAFNVTVVEGPGGGAPVNPPADVRLTPGAVLAIQMVRGDLEASGLGTVTYVDGKSVYGFGHPMFNNGTVDLPMSTGVIHMVVPSSEVAFKMGSAIAPVGTLRVDQSSGVAGVLGAVPEMLPVTLKVKRGDLGEDTQFKFSVVKDPELLLSFLNAAVGGGLSASGQPDQQVKITVGTRIELEGYPPIVMNDVYGGPQAAVASLATFINPLGIVIHNPYTRVNIKSVEITSEITPGDPRAFIRYAETARDEYRPGEEIDVAVTLQGFRSKPIIRHYKIKVPANAEEGTLGLMICDADTDARMESREMPHRFRPEDVEGIFAFYRRERPSTDLYFRLSPQESGMAVKGRELADLPASVMSVMGKQPSTEVVPFATVEVIRRPTEFVIVGRQMLQVRILTD